MDLTYLNMSGFGVDFFCCCCFRGFYNFFIRNFTFLVAECDDHNIELDLNIHIFVTSFYKNKSLQNSLRQKKGY